MKKPPARRTPLLLLPAVVLLGVLGWFAFDAWRASSAAAAARVELLQEVEDELARRPVDTSALSRLVARIQKLDDHANAVDLLAAQARIELARGRPERAFELYVSVGDRPAASDADRRLLATILLRRHEGGGGDRSTRDGWLRDGAALALRVAEATGAAADWFAAWQAAVRLGDDALATRCREQLSAVDAESREARLAAAAASFRPEDPPDALRLLGVEYDEPPVELAAMLVLLQLQAGETAAAVAAVEPLLARAGGVTAVRWCAALVFHVCVLNSRDEVERGTWLPRRNAQLDWLLENTSPEDVRREQWAAMRAS